MCGIRLKAICTGKRCGSASWKLSSARGLAAEFLQRRAAAAGHRLVGRHVDALDADRAMDRRQRDQHLHGRAVRVGDDAARAVRHLRRD